MKAKLAVPFLVLFAPLVSSKVIEVSREENVLIERIKTAQHNFLMITVDEVPNKNETKEQYIENLIKERINDFKEGKSSLLYAYKDDLEDGVGALFNYSSDLIMDNKISKVVVHVGFVPMTKNQTDIPTAVEELLAYGEKQYTKREFLSYLLNKNEKVKPFRLLLEKNNYKEKTFANAFLSPKNFLEIFPAPDFTWYSRAPQN